MNKNLEGIVVGVSGELSEVRLSYHSDCVCCGACSGENSSVISAKNKIGAVLGQKVVVEIPETGILKTIFVVFIAPLLAIVAGIYAGLLFSRFLRFPEFLSSTLAGLLFFFFSILLIRRVNAYYGSKSNTNTIVKKI